MARVQVVTMLIYEEDKKLIEALALNHRNIETGGDLFGLWQNESEVVVQVVTGPGVNCRRTATAFFQDKNYLSDVGNYLTSSKGLCNIGEWHSHHSLNLPEPSGGDRDTVWRNMPGYGLKRFLLVIATIKPEANAEMNGFMFTSPEHGSRQGQMIHVHRRILPGPNPFRNQPEVLAKLREGAEIPRVEIMADTEFKKGGRMTTKENRKQLNKRDKEDRRKTEMAEKDKRKQQKKAEKEKKKETNKQGKKENKMKNNKIKRFGIFRNKGGKNYSSLPDNGGTSGHFSQATRSGSMTDLATASQRTNNVTVYQGAPATRYPQQVQHTSERGEISSNLLPYSRAHPSSTPRYHYLKNTVV